MAFKRIFKNTAFLYAPGILNPLGSLLLVAAVAWIQGGPGHSLALTVCFIAESLTVVGLSVPQGGAVGARKVLASPTAKAYVEEQR